MDRVSDRNIIRGYIDLLEHISGEKLDNLKNQLGVPDFHQLCLNCGGVIESYYNKKYCSHRCFSEHHKVHLFCSECGIEILLLGADYRRRRKRRKVSEWFCSKQCYGRHIGRVYGFGFELHPRKSKWNLALIKDLMTQGYSCGHLALEFGIAKTYLYALRWKWGLTNRRYTDRLKNSFDKIKYILPEIQGILDISDKKLLDMIRKVYDKDTNTADELIDALTECNEFLIDPQTGNINEAISQRIQWIKYKIAVHCSIKGRFADAYKQVK